jgi:chromosome segregation ATPase
MAFLGLMTVREHEAVVADAKRELDQLATSIWRAEFRYDAPEWQPLPDIRGLISQVDSMYAGVRSQRDEQSARANSLASQRTAHMTAIAGLQCDVKALRAELATLKAERDGILRDKIAEAERSDQAVSRGLALMREIEALRPDALKYRERLRRDREALAAKRKLNAPAVRLTPASPPPA